MADDKDSWTFAQAFELFSKSNDASILDSLDTFLKTNSDLLESKSIPFVFHEFKDDELLHLKENVIRGVQYPVPNEKIIKYCITVSRLLNVDVHEVLRICKQNFVDLVIDRNDSITEIIKLVTQEIALIIQLRCLLLQSKRLTINSDDIFDGIFDYLNEYFIKKGYFEEESPYASLIANEKVNVTVQVLNFLAYLSTEYSATKEQVVTWFKIMELSRFASILKRSISNSRLESIQSLLSVITNLILDLNNNYGGLDHYKSYLNDAVSIQQISESLNNTSPSCPIVLYSWSILLHRKYLVLESFPDNPHGQKLLGSLGGLHQLQQQYLQFSKISQDQNVIEKLVRCHKNLYYDAIFTTALGTLVLHYLPYLSLTDQVSQMLNTIFKDCLRNILIKLFQDEYFERLLTLARAKFPRSIVSYLNLASLNTNFALEEVTCMKSYMESFDEDSLLNKYEIDDQNPELVKITQDIDIFPPFESSKELSLLMRDGTKGKLLSGNMVVFIYDYNGWTFLGRILQNISRNFNLQDDRVASMISILQVFTRVTEEIVPESAESFFALASTFVDDSDVIEVIFRLFDQCLHARCLQGLEAIAKFIQALCRTLSYRVWSYLSHSQLFSVFASTILGAVEMVSGDYSFTITLIKMVDTLVVGCLSLDTRVSARLKSQVLINITSHMLHIFEIFYHCRFEIEYQKWEIGTLLVDVFGKLLVPVYGIDGVDEPENKATAVFAKSAQKIVDSFLVPDLMDVRSNKPITKAIDDLLTKSSTLDLTGVWYSNWNRAIIGFTELLLSIRSVCGMPPSILEKTMFAKSPSLVDVYHHHTSLRLDVTKLLTSLVNAKWPNEPPSLLAYLGKDQSYLLLNLLAANLTNSLVDYDIKVSIYDLFSAVMEGDQEGLSIMFITGHGSNEKFQQASISLLEIMKKCVIDLSQYPDSVALHLVDAIALAFNSWTTAKESKDDEPFIGQLITRISKRNLIDTPQTNQEFINACYEHRLISKIAEILSLFLFVSNNEKCKRMIVQLIESDEFLETIEADFRIEGYKSSLHNDLHEKFQQNWPGMKLDQFAHSSLVKRKRYGENSVFALGLLDDLFESDERWADFRNEIIQASINLQYISAQLLVAKSLSALITTYFKKATAVDIKFIKLATQLLLINDRDGIPAPIFKEPYYERIDLAFFIVYNFSKTTKQVDDKYLADLISAVSQLIISPTDLYRPLLRILYACLKLIKKDTNLFAEHFTIFERVFDLVVCQNTRYLFASLTSDQNLPLFGKLVENILLNLALLKTFFNMNLPKNLANSFAKPLVRHGTLRSILNLYSSSHSLNEKDNLILADIAITFIHELVTVKGVTKELISNRLFSNLIESPVSLYIQNGHITATSTPRLHNIWSNGLLSIILSILGSFGESVLPEVCSFVTCFAKQIATCIHSWSSDSLSVSLPLIQETSQLIMLYSLLKALNFKDYMISNNLTFDSGVKQIMSSSSRSRYSNDSEQLQNRFFPGLDTLEQRNALGATLSYLLSHPKYLMSRAVDTNLIENKSSQFQEELINGLKELRNSLKD
ncbi:Nuclear pore complex subunit [Komagataella phaffii CBS 7435]|uniref:Nucleoporin NUP188 n=2 Tax=Komagataella phaffii TaxID=460519 RepID=C4QV53_KOMPG|nr:Subunit of the nuclear pore complex (NPC) [Komagataella phaffii GS115]CAH2445778.1 Nuclear pore complex subunit [Komagataella phaffii CBS 7435]CAY67123.1 Subunit of the nuclear pore complex (NPC) [Komagataella phaffii GS115]CCA36236.1 Nuclear pore complex subunit [Komagataella phaffii CBS 7435]